MKRIILCMSIIMCCGCAVFRSLNPSVERDVPVQKLAQSIQESLRNPAIKSREIAVLTFVDLNDFKKVDPFGRYVQEKLAYYLFDMGYKVKELRLAKAIEFDPQLGELAITRVKEQLRDMDQKSVKALVLGTYIDTGATIYINARLIDLENGMFGSIGELTVKKGGYLKTLLGMAREKAPIGKDDVFERLPETGK